MRANVFHTGIGSEGKVDYVLELIDVCEFANMEPLENVPEQLIYRVGMKDSVTLDAGVDNPLCPLTN